MKVRQFMSCVLVLLASAAFAETNVKYFEIVSVEVQEVSELQILRNDPAIGSIDCDVLSPLSVGNEWASDALTDLNAVDMILDQVINIGKKIWNLITAGRPVSQFNTSVATALPAGARCWTDLENWKVPESRVYEVGFKNGFGAQVMQLSYRVLWLPGGQVKGQGQYIGYATVQPVSVSVMWGFQLDAEVSVPTVFNMGTKTDPIAGMQINVNYRAESILTKINQGQSFFINGLGDFKKMD